MTTKENPIDVLNNHERLVVDKALAELQFVAGQYDLPHDLATTLGNLIGSMQDYHVMIKSVFKLAMEQHDKVIDDLATLNAELDDWEWSDDERIIALREDAIQKGFDEGLESSYDVFDEDESAREVIVATLDKIRNWQPKEKWALVNGLVDHHVLLNDPDAQAALLELYEAVSGETVQVVDDE